MAKWPPTDGYVCPHCGEPLKRNAGFCRHCGSDESTGWSPDTHHAQDWDDPEDLEDIYDEAFQREFGTPKDRHSSGKTRRGQRKTVMGPALWVIIVAIAITLLFAWQLLRNVF